MTLTFQCLCLAATWGVQMSNPRRGRRFNYEATKSPTMATESPTREANPLRCMPNPLCTGQIHYDACQIPYVLGKSTTIPAKSWAMPNQLIWVESVHWQCLRFDEFLWCFLDINVFLTIQFIKKNELQVVDQIFGIKLRLDRNIPVGNTKLNFDVGGAGILWNIFPFDRKIKADAENFSPLRRANVQVIGSWFTHVWH